MASPVGIDLGTTNSVIAVRNARGAAVVVPNAEGSLTTPSVVAFDGERGVLMGDEALQLHAFGLCPGAALFKRSMGDPAPFTSHGTEVYTASRLSSLVLRKLADDASAELGGRPTQAVVTVPAYFTDPERVATLEAARLAGLECLQLINEPTAAAIAFRVDDQSQHQGGTRRVMVYDLGGGTFDVTVLESGNLASVLDSRGDPRLGGADWDRELARMLFERAAADFGSDIESDPMFAATLRREAEALKKRLSQVRQARVALHHAGRVSELSITQAEFEGQSRGLLLRSLNLIREVLDSLSLHPSQIDEVLLVGGSTRMPMVRQALTEFFGRPPLRTLNPDEAVAQGAALKADSLVRAKGLVSLPGPASSTGLVDIPDNTNFGLGMIAVDAAGLVYVNRVMIPRATRLPAQGSEFFTHAFQTDTANALQVFVTQGDAADPQSMDYLGCYGVNALPGLPMGRRGRIEIAFGYDLSGVVTVRARSASGDDPAGSEWLTMTRSDVPDDVPERFMEAPPVPATNEPLTVMLFFDVSGSMSGQPIREARKAALNFVAQMDLSVARVGIGVVADRSHVLLTPSDTPIAIHDAISQIAVNCAGVGGCNNGHPFSEIMALLGNETGQRTAVVLADGVWSNPDRAIQASRECKARGIEIIAVGFGGADEAFLDAVSSARDLQVLSDATRLTETFGSIARMISSRSGHIRT